MSNLKLALFPDYGRSSFRVIDPSGEAENIETSNDVFYGILKLAAKGLIEKGRLAEGSKYAMAIRQDVCIDLEDLLSVGYRVEGVPTELWDLILNH